MKTTANPPQPSEVRLQPAGVAARPMLAAAKVFLAGRLTALTAPGGAEPQMLALARALPDVGVAARLWRPWEDPLAEAKCLHLFGTSEEFVPLVDAAHRCQVKVILSPLVWQETSPDRPEPLAPKQPLARKVTAWAGSVGRSVCPRWPSRQRHLYHTVDLLLPNSNAEAQRLLRQFHVPAEQMHIVPHGADLRFGLAEAEPFTHRYAVRDFVLYVGPVEPCCQQLGFLLAMRHQERPVVILGDVSPGYEWYMDECRRVAGPGVRFLPHLRGDDPLLASAYAACACIVIPEGIGAPERVALEAGMSGTPLVLFAGSSACEYFGHQAVYVKPEEVHDIRRGVLEALARRRSPSLAEHVRTYFSWTAAAKMTREAYAKVLRERRGGEGA